MRDTPRPAEGAFGKGFLTGAFLGVFALIWAYADRKDEATKRGVRYGFLFQAGLGALLRLVAHLAG